MQIPKPSGSDVVFLQCPLCSMHESAARHPVNNKSYEKEIRFINTGKQHRLAFGIRSVENPVLLVFLG